MKKNYSTKSKRENMEYGTYATIYINHTTYVLFRKFSADAESATHN